MNIPKSSVMTFNGHDHHLTAVIGGWDQYPDVEIASSEINDFADIEFTPIFTEAPDFGSMTLFFKQKGKYTVLIGREAIVIKSAASDFFSVKGKLISTPVLKGARIPGPEEVVEVVAPPEVHAPTPRPYQKQYSSPPPRVEVKVKPKPRTTFLQHGSKP